MKKTVILLVTILTPMLLMGGLAPNGTWVPDGVPSKDTPYPEIHEGTPGVPNSEEVHSEVPLNHQKLIPPNVATEVTHVTLHRGTWYIGGQSPLDIYQGSGMVFGGGNISLSVSTSSEGRTNWGSVICGTQISWAAIPLAMPSRRIHIDSDNTKVYLVAANVPSYLPPTRCLASGFISAVFVQGDPP